MKISGKEIGLEHDPYIIAEVGVNYDNDMNYAEELIMAAKRAGADAVKFQTYTPSKIVAINSPKYWEDGKPKETQFEFFERSNTFYHEETKELAELCKKHQITFMSTPFDLESVDLLDALGMPAYKIASADITNYPLLRKAAQKQKVMLISTGASSIGEIEEAVSVIRGEGNDQIILLHCILAYPTPAEHSNLMMIQSLRDVFPELEVGWSDHVIPEKSLVIPTVAAVLGATVIEKHFTTDRTRKGNDHFHSVDEEQLKQMIVNIKLARESMGEYLKQPMEVEGPARKNARRSIAASRDIKIGEEINDENLILLRPGSGIAPKMLDVIVGMKAKREIKSGYLLEWEDIVQ